MSQKSARTLAIEDLFQKGKEPAEIRDLLFAKYGDGDKKKFHQLIRRKKQEWSRGGGIIQQALPSTKSSGFAKLKTELGLHENIYGLPEPDSDEIKVHQLPAACSKILLLPDIHIPFHTIEALTAALKYGKERGANCIYLNGDVVDMYAISRFEKDKRLRNFKRELEDARQFLSIVRQAFPEATLYFKAGNHEMRWNAYIREHAKEFEGIDDFAFESVFRLTENGFHYIPDKDFAQAGKLFILHGHEPGGVNSPVNPARGIFLKGMQSCLVSHHHRTSEHSGKNLEQSFITCWSTGCLSQLRPKYNPLSQYNHGFAFIEVEAGGDFKVENKRIDNGKIY